MVQRVQSIRSSIKLQRPTTGTREPGELYVNFADLQLGVSNASKVAQDLLAVRFFSSATDYVAGDFVINAGTGYKAKGPITAGAFNPAQWDTINVSGTAEPPIALGTTSQYWRGDKSWQTLDKTAVGLANVDNTADANKPVSGPTQAALNLKAPLASPTFTGTVIAPTQAAGTNNTTVATTEFVARDFAPIMSPTFGGDPRAPTPATADNDTSIATTSYVKANLAGYAPLDSPLFIGNPRGPTPTEGDADTSLATTAFVSTAIGNKPNDAPSDGNWYGRRNGGWADVTEEAPADGVSYGRKNGAWVASVGGAVISDGPPPGPLTPGQLWWEADSGNTYLWFDDGTSQQWIQQNIAAPISGMPSGLTAETRNRIVNGAMQVSQENGNTAGTGTAYYMADQWYVGVTSTGAIGGYRVASVTPNGSVYRLRVTVTTADTSLAAGEYLQITQKLEGSRIADFRWGTASARQVVARFGFRAPAGTYTFRLGNGVVDRTYLKNFTITVGQANTDTEQVLVIPGDVTGTWLTDTSLAAYIGVGLAGGTTFQGTDGAWQSGSPFVTAVTSNGLGVISQNFELYDVGLYLDPLNTGVPPRWQMPDEAEELKACMRYFQYGDQMVIGTITTMLGTFYSDTFLPTHTRTTPAVSFTGVNYSNASGLANNTTTFRHLRLACNSTGTAGNSLATFNVFLNARM